MRNNEKPKCLKKKKELTNTGYSSMAKIKLITIKPIEDGLKKGCTQTIALLKKNATAKE